MRAVIFDFDGVLVDSEKLHFRAQRDALIPEGIVQTAKRDSSSAGVSPSSESTTRWAAPSLAAG